MGRREGKVLYVTTVVFDSRFYIDFEQHKLHRLHGGVKRPESNFTA